MNMLNSKRLLYILKKVVIIPVGLLLSLLATAGVVYYLPAVLQADIRYQKKMGEISGAIDKVVGGNPNWSTTVRSKLSWIQGEARSGNLARAKDGMAEVFQDEVARTNRDLFLVRKDIRDLIYLGEFSNYYSRFLLISGGCLLIGLAMIGWGLLKARKMAYYLEGKSIMENLRKFEPPELPKSEGTDHARLKAVKVFININKFGHITEIEMVEGPRNTLPYLIHAMRKWRFDPFLYKGRSIPVMGEIVINLGK